MEKMRDSAMEKMWWWWSWLSVLMMAMAVIVDIGVQAAEVTYDGRSLLIEGQRKILFSGSILYPRSTPQMWPSLIAKAKEGGLDVIDTYVFWNVHEPQPGQYDFSGRYDLVAFIKQIQAQGLYVTLRIGPFIQSEWNYGGFPFWLHDVPGIVYRTDNQPFKFYMQNFTTKIVDMMKSEGLYASQGGPIILSQIENEYQKIQDAFGKAGSRYVRWAAKMAVGLRTGVPWVMCQQTDAPDPVINTCNGFRCGENFTGPNSPNKPSLWTENYSSMYQFYGEEPYVRPVEDMAFHVALFIARNGSYVNYYVYHGGTNFGRTGTAYLITAYYDQSPLDEYGLLRQPKWGHLKGLHAAIKSCSSTLLQGVQKKFSLGQLQEGYTFEEEKGGCVAFLINNDTETKVTVQFRNRSYELLPKSISILPDCQNVTFNTANVSAETNRRITTTHKFTSAHKWEQFQEVVSKFDDTALKSNSLLEHTSTTKDKSDYLWYTLRFERDLSCSEPILHIQSIAHVVHAFVDDTYIGGAHGSHDVKSFTLDLPVTLNQGTNNISILSAMVGLWGAGAFLERTTYGLTKVEIQCSEEEFYDLTNYTWGYKVGLVGEQLQVYKEQNSSDEIDWSQLGETSNQTLTWYKTVFESPEGDEPVALNLSSMGKGEAWVNGESIGRYWVSFLTSKGKPSQSLYHVPRSFLKASGNVLVLMEEAGGNPLGVSLNTVSVTILHENVLQYRSLPLLDM